MGTHTSNSEQENLLISNIKLPNENSTVSSTVYLDNTRESGGIGLLSKTDNKIEFG
jgi:hypothetical protein